MMDFRTEALNALNKAESQLVVAQEALKDSGLHASQLMELVELRNKVMAFRKRLG